MRRSPRLLAWSLSACLSFAGLMQPAQAALIGTAPALAAETAADSAPARLQATLMRAEVAQALQARGVDLDEAQARVAALSEAEAQQVLARIDQDPAGAGDLIGTAVFVFLVLLTTDILGFTKVFPFTRSIR
ncbi:PA2779 family protein [Ideonella livida]|uniref:PA2779 family protein n=1 Tax=Ideonella livida TaxID=2707176 RepID=A0A7C9TKD1_9BURK|nr:PA2779 family protein [Ideonella livida]NDY92641.1 PA2779 family protein [Ideonella livida]